MLLKNLLCFVVAASFASLVASAAAKPTREECLANIAKLTGECFGDVLTEGDITRLTTPQVKEIPIFTLTASEKTKSRADLIKDKLSKRQSMVLFPEKQD